MHLPILQLDGDRLALSCTYQDNELAKAVGMAKWDKPTRRWTYPVRPEIVQRAKQVFPTLVVQEDADAAARRIAEREREVRALKDVEDVEVTLPLLATPYAHQRKAFQIGITLPNTAYFMEVGTGKTLVGIAVAGHRYQTDALRRVLVVAPVSVVPNWPKEFKKFAAFPVQTTALTGASTAKIKQLGQFGKPEDALQVAVINYESAWRIEKELEKWLRAGGVSMIITDEGHRLKTPGAEQSKCFHRLGKVVDYRLLLTGTPVTQGPLDVFSMYKFLEPSIFGNSNAAFKARYARMGGFQNKKVVGYENLAELVMKTHSIAYRVQKSECLDLPPETSVIRSVVLGKESKRVYETLRKEAVAELEAGELITAQNVLTKLMRLSQLTGGFIHTEDGSVVSVGTEKLDMLDEELEDLLGAGKKVVVFCRFVAEIAEIRKRLERRRVEYRHIAGEVSQTDRGLAVDAFQNDPKVQVFIAQIQSAGLGITLTAADTAIFFSMDFSLANHEQCLGRIHRISQTMPVTYIYMLAEGTVDERVYEVLKDKKEMSRLVTDDWRSFVGAPT